MIFYLFLPSRGYEFSEPMLCWLPFEDSIEPESRVLRPEDLAFLLERIRFRDWESFEAVCRRIMLGSSTGAAPHPHALDALQGRDLSRDGAYPTGAAPPTGEGASPEPTHPCDPDVDRPPPLPFGEPT
uniref:Uncharacterized protein n=2 Tax=viral metagenome TaxID=1070528 RepID=A0A6H1ZXF2_9ZZZZ